MTPDEMRGALREFGLTQATFAERLGIHRATLVRMSVGESPVAGYVVAYIELMREMRDMRDELMRENRDLRDALEASATVQRVLVAPRVVAP